MKKSKNNGSVRSFLRKVLGSSSRATPKQPDRYVPSFEALSERINPAVTASFSAQFGQLTIIGDAQDNVISISRADNGNILVNNGEVSISGGTANVSNTTTIFALGLDGNDQITLNEFHGALPRAYLLGGSGNDLLIGGSGQDYLSGGSGNDVLRGGDNDDQLFGGTGNDTLLGDRGNDEVQGQDGNDLLIVNNGDGSDVLEGGDGFDFVQVNGSNTAGDDFSIDPNGERVRFQRNNLGLFTLDIGTVENLDVNGQGGSDVIIGSVGLNGLISLDLDGGEGNDLLIGGDGVDVLRGGAGNDVLIGGRGNDVVLGQDGSDLLIVNDGDGSDFLEGGEGFDFVQVNGSNTAGDDFSIDPNGQRVRFRRNNLSLFTLDIGTVENLDVNGQGGSDVIIGSVGLNGLISLDLDGGEGNDLLIGGDGIDVLRGGAGNDVQLIGGRGNDVVLGEDGNDFIIYNDGDGSDFIEGGEGFDFVQVNGSNTAGDDFSIDPNGERVRFRRNNLGLFTLNIGTVENLDVNSQGGNDVIIASNGLNGLISLDLDGGEGNDLLIGGDGVDVLRGGAGNDTLIGGRGNDVILGQDGSDFIIHNDGDGSDFIEGGEGFDFVQVNGSNTVGDDFSIDPNGERVRFQRNNLGLFTLDIGTVENLDVNGQGGSDVIIGSVGLNGLIGLDLDGGEGNDLLIGGDGADVLRGGAGNDVLIGGRGNDIVLGQDGSDLLIVNNGDGSDFLEGGEGFDTVQVNGSNTAGDDFSIDPNGERVRFQRNNLGLFTLDIGTVENLDVNGQGGSDVIIGSVGLNGLISLDLDGGEGNDLLVGGDGIDVLRGGAGNDVLIGGRGNDVVLGEDGNDLLIVNNGDGSDFLEGGEGIDTVQVNGSNTAGDDFSIDPNGERVRFRRNNLGLFTLNIGTVENLDVNGQGGNDVIIASNGLNGLIALDLDGGEGNDLLIGGDGVDVLRGGASNDTLIGGRGNDIVLGQDGSDFIIHNDGDGSDFIEGGSGFDFVQVNGSNTVGDDFSIDPNGERVRFQRNNLGLFTLDIGTVENLDVNGQGGSDVIIGSVGLNGLISLDLDGGEGNDLLIGGDGVDVLRGGAGNDVLIGGRGNDIVLGQDGDDLLIVNDGDGSDFLEGGAGNDTVQINGSNTEGDILVATPNGNRVEVRRTNLDLFTLSIGSTETIDVNLLGGNDRFTGSTGLAALTSLDIDGGIGSDVLTGGDGNDTLRGGADVDILLGRDGNDILIGNQGNDFVFGEGGNDLIIVNEGDGNDLIEGGLGRDTVQISTGDADDEILIRATGRVARVERSGDDPFAQAIGGTEVLDLRTNGGNDNVVVESLASVQDLQTIQIDTGDGDDVINATNLDAAFALIGRGGEGNDILFGGFGNDVLLGEAGHDIIISGAGNDFISGGDGNDILISGDGNDVIIGGDGNDVLAGGRGNDILLAGDGNDSLNGGDGTDFLDGGNGEDSAINGETLLNIP